MKLKGHSPVDLIINNRKLIEKIYIVLVIFSLICVPMVGINYDLTKYLPDSSPSAQALDIMAVSYTHLDVYKRQLANDVNVCGSMVCGLPSDFHAMNTRRTLSGVGSMSSLAVSV